MIQPTKKGENIIALYINIIHSNNIKLNHWLLN